MFINWIDANIRKPNHLEQVWVFWSAEADMGFAIWDAEENQWFTEPKTDTDLLAQKKALADDNYDFGVITHWCHLPPPPQEWVEGYRVSYPAPAPNQLREMRSRPGGQQFQIRLSDNFTQVLREFGNQKGFRKYRDAIEHFIILGLKSELEKTESTPRGFEH